MRFPTLVALALMGLVLSALASLTAQWLPSWNRGLDRVQRSEMIGIVLQRIGADLAEVGEFLHDAADGLVEVVEVGGVGGVVLEEADLAAVVGNEFGGFLGFRRPAR